VPLSTEIQAAVTLDEYAEAGMAHNIESMIDMPNLPAPSRTQQLAERLQQQPEPSPIEPQTEPQGAETQQQPDQPQAEPNADQPAPPTDMAGSLYALIAAATNATQVKQLKVEAGQQDFDEPTLLEILDAADQRIEELSKQPQRRK